MSNLSVNRNEPEGGGREVEPNLSPLVVRARAVYKAMARILAICILIQVFLAGLALFWNSAQWGSHTGFAKLLVIVSILILVISFFARLPLSLRLRSAGLIGIIILMAVIAKLPSGIGYIAALHPLLAFLLLREALFIARKSDALTKP
jgi:hypothetical protein